MAEGELRVSALSGGIDRLGHHISPTRKMIKTQNSTEFVLCFHIMVKLKSPKSNHGSQEPSVSLCADKSQLLVTIVPPCPLSFSERGE